jgi:hypothetical protein
MMYLGNYTEDEQYVDLKFYTHSLAGVPTTLSGTPAVSCYPANSTTEITTGVALTANFDGVTGLNHVRVDLSAHASYIVAQDYQLVITTGTVDSVSVVGVVLAHFSIEHRYPTPGDNALGLLDQAWAGHVSAGTVGQQIATDVDDILTDTAAMNVNRYAVMYDCFVTAAGENVHMCKFFKNDTPLNAGVTSPTIWMHDHDNADVIGTSGVPLALTDIGSHTFKFEASGAQLMVAGKAYAVRIQATIDGATREWWPPFTGRDVS